jgi:hypothetical protein
MDFLALVSLLLQYAVMALFPGQVLGGTCGKWVGGFALVLTVFNLTGNGCAQIVAGAANTYTINPALTKRCAAVTHTPR